MALADKTLLHWPHLAGITMMEAAIDSFQFYTAGVGSADTLQSTYYAEAAAKDCALIIEALLSGRARGLQSEGCGEAIARGRRPRAAEPAARGLAANLARHPRGSSRDQRTSRAGSAT